MDRAKDYIPRACGESLGSDRKQPLDVAVIVDRCEKKLAGIAADLDQVVDDLSELKEYLRTQRLLSIPRKAVRLVKSVQKLKDEVEMNRRLAERGAESFKISWQADGTALVSIDSSPHLRLPPAEASLLELLAADVGPAGDDMMGWKTVDEVLRHLAKKGHKAASRQVVVMGVYRLRRSLSDAGVNKHLVQSNRRLGYRFALKRKPAWPIISGGDRT